MGLNNKQQRIANEHQRFAFKKLNIGVVSVLVGLSFAFVGGQDAVHAAVDQPQEAAEITTVPAPGSGAVTATSTTNTSAVATATTEGAPDPASQSAAPTVAAETRPAAPVTLMAFNGNRHGNHHGNQQPDYNEGQSLQEAKDAAVGAINALGNTATTEINADQTLTSGEKDRLLGRITKVVDQITAEIAKAHTSDHVTNRLHHGIDQINHIWELRGLPGDTNDGNQVTDPSDNNNGDQDNGAEEGNKNS